MVGKIGAKVPRNFRKGEEGGVEAFSKGDGRAGLDGKSGRGVKRWGLLHGSSTGDGGGGRSEMGMGGRWLGGSGSLAGGEG